MLALCFPVTRDPSELRRDINLKCLISIEKEWWWTQSSANWSLQQIEGSLQKGCPCQRFRTEIPRSVHGVTRRIPRDPKQGMRTLLAGNVSLGSRDLRNIHLGDRRALGHDLRRRMMQSRVQVRNPFSHPANRHWRGLRSYRLQRWQAQIRAMRIRDSGQERPQGAPEEHRVSHPAVGPHEPFGRRRPRRQDADRGVAAHADDLLPALRHETGKERQGGRQCG
jgi:hypothetical protein